MAEPAELLSVNPIIDQSLTTDDDRSGSVISFHSLNYEINSRRFLCKIPLKCLKGERKKILNNLHGSFHPGLNAILGPTGSGKSSLLDILADRKEKRGIRGEILVDGQVRSPKYKHEIGYVAQDGVISGNLTVRENLMFSANIRLANSLSKSEKEKIVRNVLEQLGLNKCADSLVGDEYLRGISGGERRRTSIGLELVLSPKILFLDEPTTGLDSSTARNVIKYLHKLSKKNRTIIFSIHQPQYSILKMFDRIFLISAGLCIFHGPTTSMLPYFSSIDYFCEEHENPGDFALDLCQGDPNSTDGQKIDELSKVLNEKFMNSSIFEPIENFKNETPENSSPVDSSRNSFKREFFYLCQRTARMTFRNPALIVMQIFFPVFLGLLIGAIYRKFSSDSEIGTRNRFGAIFFIIANEVFGNLSALEIFLKERNLFAQENLNGYYRVQTYFLSKVISDLIPMRTIPSVLFSVTVYFFVGFQTDVEKFFLFLFAIFLTVISASALCFFVSATVKQFSLGNLLAAAFCTVTSIFTSLVVDVTTITPVLSWIRWLSIFQYSFNFLAINEFRGLKLTTTILNQTIEITGEQILTRQKIDHATSWDFWKNAFALMLITFIFLLLTLIQLFRMKKTK